MSALNVVTLAEAKEFIVYDDNDRDQEIITCINTAVNYVETYTNVMLFQRAKEYMLINGCLEIYDVPIGFLSTDIKTEQRILSVLVKGSANQTVNALVGYVTNEFIPGSLLMAVKKLILYYFENKDVYHADIPWDIQMLCNPFRRSATF